MALNLEKMTTEQRNPDTMNLDEMTTLQIVTEMNREDAGIPAAIRPHLPEIAKVAQWGAESLSQGGRIFYMGAGTSGRLGVLDASECPPTFGVSADTVVGLIAGGPSAIMKAVEGAEDNRELGAQDLKDHNLAQNDLVIGLAASGRTPYVIGGIEYAKSIGCRTAAITCNEGSAIGKASDCAIDVVVGPEVLTGSTRLKAGTAEKMILNMISTAAMVQIGKSYGNLMVDVVLSNEKLQVRAENIVMQATGVDRETAKRTIASAGGRCKTAITMILADCTKEEAEQRLAQADGHVRKAILHQ
ncbi:N-acetylmuramic acid 6-phosphate etherase [Galactobacillus timonensis]|uniref:N-acetylmuramic acid 6-phosphate etherase n=1 Tax=Galactobacillus timonensis TaxID=2041840 RepID=UPI000C81F997|nr:N-acetylmuramic acid 6-phosphate etherase [Galactobacillus timonensis]MDD5851379.1 N-acetylmuramic acid 6-phosphate etherase [Galactobacillus timonensis]MDD6369413.1 N-acetylmuramic acid 6-phosphate etherase [Galactobacillus timonensis]